MNFKREIDKCIYTKANMSQEKEKEETCLNEDAHRDLRLIVDRYLIEINICKSLAKKSKKSEKLFRRNFSKI